MKSKSETIFSSFKSRATTRLVLRPYKISDFTAWHEAWLSLKPAQNEWDSGPRQESDLSKQKFRTILANQKRSRTNDEALILGAFHGKDGALVGSAMFENLLLGRLQMVDIGFEVLNTYWGQGFGSEIARCQIAIAIEDLGLHRVRGVINPRNKLSIKVVEKIGMRRECRCKYFMRRSDGTWSDMIIYVHTPEME